MRDSFINGMKSHAIRQRILEEAGTLTLQQAWEKARAMETAQRNSESYSSPIYTASVAPTPEPQFKILNQSHNSRDTSMRGRSEDQSLAAAARIEKCWNCGRFKHSSMKDCPAKDEICVKCKRKGHFIKVCRDGAPPKRSTSAALTYHNPDNQYNYPDDQNHPVLAATSDSHSLKKSILQIAVDGEPAEGLVDSGSSHGYVSQSYQERRK